MVRVATFNTCRGTTGTGTPVENAALASAAASLGADILGLQELDVRTRRAGRVDQLAVIATACAAERAFAAARRDDRGRFGNGLVVRGSIADVERVALRGQGLPGFRNRRAAVLASVQAGSVTASVAVTHLSVRRDDALPELARVLDRLRRRPEPWILCGDMNLGRERVRPIVEAEGLTLVGDGGDTFPAHRPLVRIDHVAVRGFVVASVEVVELKVSDHRALVVELQPDLAGQNR